ncbi:DUF1161 domain-containing protein [Pseudomonas akapageensis]|uniref:DUF1161 domain-containing protein n=1 Tax=Pseudomonas akapageensis TaxID=2609961 RepID=UPI00140E9028|nr:DUF1161 domain-containing protein [Pseudomonas akapageensis]
MIRFTIALLCAVLSTAVLAKTKDCEELKKEIETKIQASGVSSYTLEIVSKKEARRNPSMIVGSCKGGTKKIIYQKNDR